MSKIISNRADRRKKRVRLNIVGNNNYPRVSVFRSNKFIYAQLIDNVKQVTITSESDMLELKKNSRELSMLAQDLHESNARLSAIFQASPLCIIISRLNDDIIIELNDATLQQFGYGRDEVIGQRTAADLGVYADPTQHAQLVQRLSDFGSVH